MATETTGVTDVKINNLKTSELIVNLKVSKVLIFRLKLSILLLKVAAWVGSFNIKINTENT